jgi:hypothetical protein
MTFTSAFTFAASVVGIAGLVVLGAAAFLAAVTDLTGRDLVAVRAAEVRS